jgi:MerR HTH family regulatory protein
VGDEVGWTLDELSERVAAALAVDYAGAGNGRVRDVPDRRTIRWYTTIGLVDRPAAMRGRVALYGRRHLSQLVAIKRLQAEGLSLADIQRELVGATPETVERIARVPAGVEDARRAPAPPPRRRFWTAVPDSPAARLAAAAPDAAEAAAWHSPRAAGGARPAVTGDPAETGAVAATPDVVEPAAWHGVRAAGGARPASTGDVAETGAVTAVPEVALLPAVRLAPGVTLLLPAAAGVPDDDRLASIRAAAQPLLDVLHRLGLDREDPR